MDWSNLKNSTTNPALWMLSSMALTLCLSAGAHAKIIKVTTVADQNGEDENNCSIREAIHASLAKEAYGGCEGGERGFTDTILLEGKSYVLNDEIVLTRRINRFAKPIRISGPDTTDYLARDPISGKLGKRNPPLATITAATGKRLFNTARDKIGLTISNVNLVGSNSSDILHGGAFLVGGRLALNHVTVTNARATQGGVFFAEGVSSAVSLNYVRISGNQAALGSVYYGDCRDNLSFSKRNITIKNSSIYRNTTPAAAKTNIVQFCGAPTVKLTNTTFAMNSAQDALLDFSQTKPFTEGGSITSPKLELERVTMVNNSHGIKYGKVGKIIIKNSVVAYNNAYDCRFTGNDVNGQNVLSIFDTLLTGQDISRHINSCQWRQTYSIKDGRRGAPLKDTSNSYAYGGFASYFETGLNDYGLGLLGYLPRQQSSNSPLMLKHKTNCGGLDKRGLSRTGVNSLGRKVDIGCSKGALERGQLQAVDDRGAGNVSYVSAIEKLEEAIKVEAPKEPTKKQLTEYNDYISRQKAYLKAFKAAVKGRFRAATVDIFKNDIPHELTGVTNGNLNSRVVLFPMLRSLDKNGSIVFDNKDDYIITAKPLGSASDKLFDAKGEPALSSFKKDSSFHCVFDSALNEIVAWRDDGGTTQAGQSDFCQYTLTLKSDQTVTSKGYVSVKIVNIAPIAKNLEIETEGNEAEVAIDLTKSISDDGDGLTRPSDIPEFYAVTTNVSTDASGKKVVTRVPAYVEIVKPPESGYLRFEDDGLPCPNSNAAQTETSICHTPKFTYVRSSTLSDFDFSFTYRVYDAGTVSPSGVIVGSLASNIAKVDITAKRKTGTASPILAGGGSVNIWALLALSGLALLAFWRAKRKPF